mgnify:CR=1 FL=1
MEAVNATITFEEIVMVMIEPKINARRVNFSEGQGKVIFEVFSFTWRMKYCSKKTWRKNFLNVRAWNCVRTCLWSARFESPNFKLLHRARESQLWLMLFLVPQNTDLTVRCIVSIINAVQSSLKMGQPNKMIAFPSQNVKGWKRKISAKLSSGRFLPCCKS